MSDKATTSTSWIFLSGIVFMFLGLAYKPLFFAIAIFLFASAEARRTTIAGIIGAALGLAFLFLVLGYGIGKDMAHRDGNQSSVTAPERAPQQFVQAELASLHQTHGIKSLPCVWLRYASRFNSGVRFLYAGGMQIGYVI